MTILYFLLFFTVYIKTSFDPKSYPLNDTQKEKIVGLQTIRSRNAKIITTLLGPNDYGYPIPGNIKVIEVHSTNQELLQNGYKITINEHIIYKDGDATSFSKEINMDDSCCTIS